MPPDYDTREQQMLLTAARLGYLSVVKKIVQENPEIAIDYSVPSASAYPPIYQAIVNGKSSVVKFFLERGADPFRENPGGATRRITNTYAFAMSSSNQKIKEMFLQMNPPQESLDYGLSLAIQNDDVKTAERLVSKGGQCKRSIEEYLAARDNPRTLKFLIDQGLDVNKQGEVYTPLMQASLKDERYDSAKLTRLLLDAGAKMDLQNEEGNTALHYASRSGNVVVIEMLLKRGAKRLKNHLGKTPSDWIGLESPRFRINPSEAKKERDRRKIEALFQQYGSH